MKNKNIKKRFSQDQQFLYQKFFCVIKTNYLLSPLYALLGKGPADETTGKTELYIKRDSLWRCKINLVNLRDNQASVEL